MTKSFLGLFALKDAVALFHWARPLLAFAVGFPKALAGCHALANLIRQENQWTECRFLRLRIGLQFSVKRLRGFGSHRTIVLLHDWEPGFMPRLFRSGQWLVPGTCRRRYPEAALSLHASQRVLLDLAATSA